MIQEAKINMRAFENLRAESVQRFRVRVRLINFVDKKRSLLVDATDAITWLIAFYQLDR